MQFIKIHPSRFSDNRKSRTITFQQNKYSYTSAIMNHLVEGRTGMRSAERSVVPTPVKALSTLLKQV